MHLCSVKSLYVFLVLSSGSVGLTAVCVSSLSPDGCEDSRCHEIDHHRFLPSPYLLTIHEHLPILFCTVDLKALLLKLHI